MSGPEYDVAIVGAGIVGLAHAYHLAKRGLRVGVFEQNRQAQGASIRNFGMLWPIGQPPGRMHRMALRSREIWLEILRESGLWHEAKGSLHLAYHDDEAQVLEEFTARAETLGYETVLFSPRQVQELSPCVNPNGLRTGMFSPTEICVDPREVIAQFPTFLQEKYRVTFHFSALATRYEDGTLIAGGRTWRAGSLIVCCGDELQALYPDCFADSGIQKCKLQMLRSTPRDSASRIGPMLAAGLTLRHYASFEACPSLPALKRRVRAETPEYDQFGIHVMASQNGRGEIVIGDSHEYNEAITPFDRAEIDRLILDYLASFLQVPGLQIAARWHGIYAKHPVQPFFKARPAPDVTIVTATGGAGMTLSFGIAEQTLLEMF